VQGRVRGEGEGKGCAGLCVSRIRKKLPRRSSACLPHRTWLIIPPIDCLSAISLPRPFSKMVGKLSRRSVWPVGAVSKTMQL